MGSVRATMRALDLAVGEGRRARDAPVTGPLTGPVTGAGRRWPGSPAGGGDGPYRRSLAGVDSLEVDRGDPEVSMPELPLDNWQRDPFVGHLDRVRVRWCGASSPPHPGLGGETAKLATCCGRRPAASAGRSSENAEQRSDRHHTRPSVQRSTCSQPQSSIPTIRRLPPLPPLPAYAGAPRRRPALNPGPISHQPEFPYPAEPWGRISSMPEAVVSASRLLCPLTNTPAAIATPRSRNRRS
jgi:hypothetical protein